MTGEQSAPQRQPFEREQDLAAALRAHDPDAWQQLFREQYQRVYNYAYLRTSNTADADDIASNVFAEAARGIERFRYQGAPVAAWIFRIAHHETVDLLKRRKRTETTSIHEPATADTLRARDEIAPADEWRDVADAMGKLKQEHRDVLMLRLVEGHSVQEVAALLGKTEGAVKVMQMRALQSLRGKLQP
jgi:RNA polymerase sigma-70 factor (ECF subfamily)